MDKYNLLHRLIFFIVCMLSVSLANATDLIAQREYLRDAAGTLTVQEVSQLDFESATPILTKGYSHAAHWLRITVLPSKEKNIELRIRPTYLDEITLYYPDPRNPALWIKRVTGDKYSYENRDRNASSLGFIVPASSEIKTYYLRLQTSSSALLHVQALPPAEARISDLRQDIFMMIYLGFMLWITFWAVEDFVRRPDRLTGFFIIYQVVYFSYALAITGHIAPFIPSYLAWINDSITSFLVLTNVFVSILFYYGLFALYSPPKILLRPLIVLCIFFPLAVYGLMHGYATEVLRANAQVVLIAAVLFISLAYAATKDATPSRITLRVICSLQTISLILSMFPLLGWVSATEWNLSATLIHGLISALLMYFILHKRSTAITKTAKQAKASLQLAEQALMFERQKRDEQSYFMAMITHELKTPLSVIRMSLDAMQVKNPLKKYTDQAVLDVSNIIDSCAQIDKLDGNSIPVSKRSCNVGLIMGELRQELGYKDRVKILAEDVEEIRTDRFLLRVVFKNLLENAVRYSPTNSLVNVRISWKRDIQPKHICVTVENEMLASNTPEIDKVFDKYYRAPGAKRYTGFGLGLYISRTIVSLLGGELIAEIEDRKIIFRVCLTT
ncbi:hypothetical protein LG204_13990 [Methylovorus menthalis]|uniref:sensor histidine kinase n=1 Tax=Methylovorus menthalis TaxID=1002227 RepID=UPI001E2BE7E7|nr:7TM-DISM domain-containing protein [Methylovorus menthalis]MCB4812424.1 hypothetical protein [Methylovorus menthalis]